MIKVISKKMFIPAIMLVLIIALLFASLNSLPNNNAMAYSSQIADKENIVDFADDRVLVVMNEQSTKSFIEYKTSDFSEIGKLYK